ncbi:hypothetical protein DPEC_G00040660 [Dallia pectoralis]|uniref:Uncharacterized protein n=1 Tax=Dallia pectoralis TaxID=75939 RepID=A0ACC2HEW2_DALPE|nr:hypothetical protein DPEC_G00040660 [Dallia pectoralis]
MGPFIQANLSSESGGYHVFSTPTILVACYGRGDSDICRCLTCSTDCFCCLDGGLHGQSTIRIPPTDQWSSREG